MGVWTPEVEGSVLRGQVLFYEARVVGTERTEIADGC